MMQTLDKEGGCHSELDSESINVDKIAEQTRNDKLYLWQELNNYQNI